MMDINQELLVGAITADGPDGLMQVLDQLRVKSEQVTQDKEFVILYQLGSQRSILKVDFNQKPYHFFYKDLLGRPMTKAVEQTIAQFLSNHCGEWESVKKEVVKDEFNIQAAVQKTLYGWRDSVAPASHIGFFAPAKNTAPQQPAAKSAKFKFIQKRKD
jgi:hypothetical protein